MSITSNWPRVSYSFGSGFYAWFYHCGVAAYVQEHGLTFPGCRFYGTSSGLTAAVYLACGVDVERAGLAAGMACNDRHVVHRRWPFLQPTVIRESIFEYLDGVLPSDAHVRASGVLFTVVCELPHLRRRLVSEYRTRYELFEVAFASLAIPGYSVWLPYRPRVANLGRCLDGGLVENAARDQRSGWDTVRVGVSAIKSVICPLPAALDIQPTRPLPARMRFTVCSDAERRELFRAGKEDARRFFARIMFGDIVPGDSATRSATAPAGAA